MDYVCCMLLRKKFINHKKIIIIFYDLFCRIEMSLNAFKDLTECWDYFDMHDVGLKEKISVLD